MTSDLFSAAPKPTPALPPVQRPPAVEPAIVDGHEVYRCAVCLGPASFAFGRDSARGKPGTWYCGPHKAAGT